MSCRNIQEQLYERLGQKTLPPDIEAHISQCEGCRDLWNELEQLQLQLGTDEVFYLETHEIDELTEGVMREIDASTPAVITPFYRIARMVLPVAASLLLLLGVSQLPDRPISDDWSSDITISDIFNDDYYPSGYDDTSGMDAATLELLLSDYASSDVVTPDEALLDDLSDEEFEYLKDNLDMGELL
ncbi:MAG: hypothetical protein KOO62_01015 [candidate division Zixibacteria bacterium]|nr:hypothetical protein [candidate division Zixibacteria bacterium]